MAIAFVSGTNVSAGGASPTTSGVDTTGANFIAVAIGWFNSGQLTTAPSVTDNKSNTFTSLTVRNTGSNLGTVLYYCKSPTVGSGHTFTLNSVALSTICAASFSGVDTSSPFDLENGAGNASAASIQPGSITPSANNEIVITSVCSGLIDPFSINGGFSIAQQSGNGGNTFFPSGLAYLIQTSAAAANPTWTSTSGPDQMAAAIASFKAAAAGGFTPTFRNTLSPMGTRIGSRQTQAS